MNQDSYTKNQYFKNSCKKKFVIWGYHVVTERHGKSLNLILINKNWSESLETFFLSQEGFK